jgi:hypothetical protein
MIPNSQKGVGGADSTSTTTGYVLRSRDYTLSRSRLRPGTFDAASAANRSGPTGTRHPAFSRGGYPRHYSLIVSQHRDDLGGGTRRSTAVIAPEPAACHSIRGRRGGGLASTTWARPHTRGARASSKPIPMGRMVAAARGMSTRKPMAAAASGAEKASGPPYTDG